MPKTTEGVLTITVAPSTVTGSPNIPVLKVQTSRQLEAGNATFRGDTSGEFFMLNEQEKFSVAQTCVDKMAGHAPVVTHIGEISTHETIRLGQQTERPGVDVVSVITPYFVPLKQEESIVHYSTIADAPSIPMFLYSIPARTGNMIQSETVCVLAPHPSIIGIKDNIKSGESLGGLLDVVHDIDGFNVLNDPDSLIHKGPVEGYLVCISRFTNITPREISAIWSRFHAGDIEGSYEAQESVADLHTDLYKVAFSPAVVEKALQLMGHGVNDSRYAVNFTPEQISETQQIIRHYNINQINSIIQPAIKFR